MRLGATPVRTTPDGFKVYRGTATYGDVVLKYPDLSPPRNEFVPADEALSPEAVASLLHMPFSIEHPPDLLDASTAREHVVGSVILAEADLAQRPPALVVEVMVYDLAAQEDIESGRMCELSPGYRCEEEPFLGSHGGERYQVVQRRRRYNHLSGVSQARTVTPDGRPARLDEAAAGLAYPPPVAPEAPHQQDRTKDTMPPIEQDKDKAPGAGATGGDASDRRDVKMCDALSPEDAEILKTLSAEGQAAIMAALGGGMTSSEGSSGPAVGSDAPAPGQPASAPGGVGDITAQLLAALEAMPAKIVAAMKGTAPAGDAAPSAPPADAPQMADKKDSSPPAATVSTSAGAFDPATVIAEARKAASDAASARFDEAARLVGVVRRDGHRDVDTPADAVKTMLVVVGEALPDLKATAEAHVTAGRMDDLTILYKQAEKIRRERHLDAQGRGVLEALSSLGPDDATHNGAAAAWSFRAPTPRGS